MVPSHHRQRQYSLPLRGCQRLSPPILLSTDHIATPGGLGEILQTPGHQGRPARLVTSPQAASSLAMEVFVEQHQLAPVRVGGKTPVVAMAGAAAIRIRGKEA